MNTKSKFFANVTINSKEDFKELLKVYNSFVFVENEKEEAIKELVAIVNSFSLELENNALSVYANADNIIDSLIPSITLTDRESNNDNLKVKKVYNSVSYKQYRVIEDGNGYVIKERDIPVTLSKIKTYLSERYAFGHADMKVKKEDREKAENLIINNDVRKALKLFMYSAYKAENIADKVEFNFFSKSVTEDENKLFIDFKPSKAIAEKQINKLAESLNIDVKFMKIHGLDFYKSCYKKNVKGRIEIPELIKVLQDFIITARYAKNGIELPKVKDKAGIFEIEEVTENDVLSFS